MDYYDNKIQQLANDIYLYKNKINILTKLNNTNHQTIIRNKHLITHIYYNLMIEKYIHQYNTYELVIQNKNKTIDKYDKKIQKIQNTLKYNDIKINKYIENKKDYKNKKYLSLEKNPNNSLNKNIKNKLLKISPLIDNNIISIFIIINMMNIEFNIKYNINKKIKKIKLNNNKLNKDLEDTRSKYTLLTNKIYTLRSKSKCILDHLNIQKEKYVKEETIINDEISDLVDKIEENSVLIDRYNESVNNIENKINNINIRVDNKYIKYLNNEDDCIFCLEKMEKGIVLHCNHSFHYVCFNLYLNNILNDIKDKDITCPICRRFI